MKIARTLAALALALAAAGCGKSIPTSSDPEGKDIVEGAVVAALEKAGGIRLYKVTHVEDLPDPMGPEYHMIAYDSTSPTYEKAAEAWGKPDKKIAMEHILIRAVNFLPRDHRVLAVEPLTDAERATYTKSRDSRTQPANPAEVRK